MTKAEVTAKFDEIVAFAGIDKFLDTPVKRYSSGMYVRLAFAVAAHLEPEILLVDEVLAVGDAEFQQRCLGKMRDVCTQQGRTVLFVSHNITAVASLCSRAILLDGGLIMQNADADQVIKSYLSSLSKENETRDRIWSSIDSAPGDDRIRIHRISIFSDPENLDSSIDMTTPFRIVVEYWNLVDDAVLIVDLILRASDGTPVFESLTTEEPNWSRRPRPCGLFRSTCFVPAHLLNQGTLTLDLYILFDDPSNYFELRETATFCVRDMKPRSIATYERFMGHVHPRLEWKTVLIAQSDLESDINRRAVCK
jgi:lipopolysaccharide transport system ATP-binding protein